MDATTSADQTGAESLTGAVISSGATSAAHELAALLDCCPTCLSYGGQPLPGDGLSADAASCATCGTASLEWVLVTQLDTLLAELSSYERLAAAIS